VVTATQQIEVGEESVKTFRLQLDQTKAFYQSGLRTKIDVATGESALAGAELTLTPRPGGAGDGARTAGAGPGRGRLARLAPAARPPAVRGAAA
jgi:hypothetical protein